MVQSSGFPGCHVPPSLSRTGRPAPTVRDPVGDPVGDPALERGSPGVRRA